MVALPESAATYALNLAERTRTYIDQMLAPFLGTRVKVYIGLYLSVDRNSRTMKVLIGKVPETTAYWGATSLPGNPVKKKCRFLLDSRTRRLFFDDIMPKAFPDG
jgi:hypothetical protein